MERELSYPYQQPIPGDVSVQLNPREDPRIQSDFGDV